MGAAQRVGFIGVCLVGLAVGGARVCRADPPAENKSSKLLRLFEERAKTAEKAYTACSNAYLTGTLGLDQVLNASNELTNAKLALCKTKDDRFTVRQADVVREKSIEDRIKALANANAKGGEAENLFRASLNRVNAEIALELEKDGAAVR